MTCKEVQEKLVDLLEDTLDDASRQLVLEHIDDCPDCIKAKEELTILMKRIDQYEDQSPAEVLDMRFEAMLEQEKALRYPMKAGRRSDSTKWWTQAIKVAASILLVLTAYYFGLYSSQSSHQAELALMKEKMALSLMESNSASKRIQAVMYSQEFDHTNDRILQALIKLMNNDKQVNVRLAAVNALSRYAEVQSVKEALIERLEVEQNPSMQLELIQILIKILDDQVAPAIKKLQDDEKTPVFLKDEIRKQIG